jgi:hypothetical protein
VTAEIDLDAITAAESEASGEPHKVVWGGETFLVPRINDWPSETFDVLSRGELTSALAGLLGDDWDAFWQAKHPTFGAAKALFESICQREGFTHLGESLASLPTPNRATRRSRPTSSGSTGSTS